VELTPLAIAGADDRPFGEDGATHGTPTWIWSDTVDGSLPHVRPMVGARARAATVKVIPR
jgi:hypothetical protein